MFKKKLANVFRSIILEFFLIAPVVYIISGMIISNVSKSAQFLLLSFLNFLFVSLFFYYFSKKKKIISLLLSMIYMLIIGFNFLEADGLVYFYVIICFYIIFRSNDVYRAEDIEEIPSYYYYAALFTYLIGLFFVKRLPSLEGYKTLYSFFTFISFLNIFYQLNRKEVIYGARDEGKTPFSLIKQNRKLVNITIVVIIAISFIKQIADGIKYLFNEIISLFIRLLIFLSSLLSANEVETNNETGNGNMGQMFKKVEEGKETPRFIMIILYVIVGIIVFVFISFLLYKIYKAIRSLIKKIILWLKDNRRSEQSIYVYEDEQEVNVDFKKNAKDYLNKMKKKISNLTKPREKLKNMKTPREKIRYIYRYMVKSSIKTGISFDLSLTPTETYKRIKKSQESLNIIDEAFISIYNKARYTNKKISDNDIKDIISNFNIKNN